MVMIPELALYVHHVLGEGVEPLRKRLANVETCRRGLAKERFGILDDVKRARLYGPNRGGVSSRLTEQIVRRKPSRAATSVAICVSFLSTSTVPSIRKNKQPALFTLGNNDFPWAELSHFATFQQFDYRKHEF